MRATTAVAKPRSDVLRATDNQVAQLVHRPRTLTHYLLAGGGRDSQRFPSPRASRRSELSHGQSFSGRPHGVNLVRFAVLARWPSRPVDLAYDLTQPKQMSGQTSAVASSALHRPHPPPRRFPANQLHKLDIACLFSIDSSARHQPPRRRHHCTRMAMAMSVNSDDVIHSFSQ